MQIGHLVGKDKFFLAYCNSLFIFGLFSRMRESMASRGWSLLLVTPVLSVYLRARCQRIRCHLIKNGQPEHLYQGLDARKTREYLQNLAGIEPLQRFQNSLLSSLETIASGLMPSAVAVWNGLDAGTQATLAFANQFGIPKIRLELGNIDSKMFVDPEGVNANSTLTRNPEILDAWQIPDEEFSNWLTKFQAQRLATAQPPQARLSRTINIFYLLDRIGMSLLRTPQPSIVPIFKKIASKFQTSRIPSIPGIRPVSPYIFLPLQVSSDTNLLIMSDYDNLAAIEIAKRRAGELACDLVVKVHPAETDRAMIREIERVCTEGGHLVTSLNTTELILGAEEVVTINSTAGLEALLYGKKVLILGRCFYKNFSASRARAYVLRYLVDFDPFGRAPMSLAAFDRMLEHLGGGVNSQPSMLDTPRG